MTIKIALDRQALLSLIESDPEFKMQVQDTICSEIVRKFFEKDARRIIATADPELFANAVAAFKETADIREVLSRAFQQDMVVKSDSYYRDLKLKPEVAAAINTAVETKKREVISSATQVVETAYSETVKNALDAKLAATDIDKAVQRRVDFLVDAEIKKRTDEAVAKRLADFRSMLTP